MCILRSLAMLACRVMEPPGPSSLTPDIPAAPNPPPVSCEQLHELQDDAWKLQVFGELEALKRQLAALNSLEVGWEPGGELHELRGAVWGEDGCEWVWGRREPGGADAECGASGAGLGRGWGPWQRRAVQEVHCTPS